MDRRRCPTSGFQSCIDWCDRGGSGTVVRGSGNSDEILDRWEVWEPIIDRMGGA